MFEEFVSKKTCGHRLADGPLRCVLAPHTGKGHVYVSATADEHVDGPDE